MTVNYVTLVAQGGTPVRLADQTGAPYPTTGAGALVFNQSPTITGANLINPFITGAHSDVVYTAGLFVNASTFHIPTPVMLLATSGYSVVGVGGAMYKRTNSLPPFGAGFQDADGQFWVIVSERGLLITQFGALPDSNLSFTGDIPVGPTYTSVPVTGTNNSPAINNALLYAASLPSGGTVQVPATGVFGTSESIQMQTNTTLTSLGGWLVRLSNVLAPGNTPAFVRLDDSEGPITVRGLYIDANAAGQIVIGGSQHTIRIHNCQNYELSWNWLLNGTGYGISHDVSIANGLIAYNHIYNTAADGVDVHNTDDAGNSLTIIGNTIIGFGRTGNPKGGIHGRGDGLQIIGNIIKTCFGVIAGIGGIVVGNGETVYGQKIIGNYVEMGPLPASGFTGKGIVTNNPGSIVQGNTVIGDTGIATGFIANGATNVFTGNVVTPKDSDLVSVTTYGFNLGVTAVNGVFADNVAVACGLSGFFDQGTGNRYSANFAQDCIHYAFDMSNSTGALLDHLNTQSNCTLGLLRRGTGTLFDQATDISSTPTFANVTLPSFPVAGTDAANRAWVESFVTGNFTPYNNAAPIVAPNVTTESVLVTIPILGNSMGLNGSFEIMTLWDFIATANLQFRVRFGQFPVGTNVAFLGVTLTTFTNRSARFITNIGNAGAANAQIGWAANNGSYGFSGTDCQSGAINTLIDQNIYITVTKTTAVDSCTLRRATVLFTPGT